MWQCLRNKLSKTVEVLWYQKPIRAWFYFLIPFSFLFEFIVYIRRQLYYFGIMPVHTFSKPIIVVGNITVGGTGKTPLVIHIARLLQSQGLRPGIVSRGYRGYYSTPTFVTENSDPLKVGDEPFLMFKQLNCKVVVAKSRSHGVKMLLESGNVDIIISDDGLQHYAMHRTLEIAVIDGERRFGNGFCLPAGPLREPQKRLNSVTLKVVNGGIPEQGEYDMVCHGKWLHNAVSFEDALPVSSFSMQRVNAVAGIGNPKRFFDILADQGLWVIPHIFPDHHVFKPSDIDFRDNLPVIMTEKDAVKCLSFATDKHWILPVAARVNPLFDARLLMLLKGV